MLDLVARGWLRIEPTEHEVVVLTDRRGREGDALKGYEQQVLNHIHRMTAGTLTGVSGAGVEIAGLRLSRRWWRRFTRSVAADARRQRLSKRRWNALAIGPPVVTIVLSALLWWRSVRSGEETAVVDSLRLAGARPRRRDRHPRRRPAGAAADPLPCPAPDRRTGSSRAEHWLCVRAWMEPRGFEGASAMAANSSSRALAYAAALGLADRAADELPIVPEDDRLAWSNATGEWHVVRVRYPFRPGYGRHPALMLAARRRRRRRPHRAAATAPRRGPRRPPHQRPRRLPRPGRPHPGHRPRCSPPLLIAPMLWMAWLVIAGAFDLFSTVERQGVVVRARRPQRVVPFPRLLRPLARRDRFALFIADRRRPLRPRQRLALERAHRRAAGRAGARQGDAGARLRPPIGADRHDPSADVDDAPTAW